MALSTFEPKQSDKAEYAEHIRDKLRLDQIFIRARNGDKSYARQEERYHFERRVCALSRYRHRDEINPLDGEICAEEYETLRAQRAVVVEHDLCH